MNKKTYTIQCNWRHLANENESTATLFDIFSEADKRGEVNVILTYHKALEYGEENYKFLAELVKVVNWKSWEHNERGNDLLCQTYVNMYYEAYNYAVTTLKGDELSYFFRVTD